MAERCPDSRAIGTAALNDFEFSIYERGFATISPKLGGMVFGGLWELSASDLRRLDDYEGVEFGTYHRHMLRVETSYGFELAVTYIADRTQDGNANPGYMERVIAGAKWFGLSNSYVAQLSTWLV